MEKLTNFFNCEAKGLRKTGGGNSQTSSIETASKNLRIPTVSRRSTDGQSKDRYTQGITNSRIWKYVACLLLAFFVGIGNVWGTKYYLFTPTNESVSPAHTGTLSGHFISPAASEASKEIGGVSFSHYVSLSSNNTSWSNQHTGNYSIDYDMKSTRTKFTIYVHNSHGSSKYKVNCWTLREDSAAAKGVDVVELTKGAVDAAEVVVVSTTNKRVRIGTTNSAMRIYQIVAEELGDPLLQPGDAGYQLAIKNPGRFAQDGGGSSALGKGKIDGMDIRGYSAVKYAATTKIKLKANTTDCFVKFRTGSNPGKLKLTATANYSLNTSSSSKTPLIDKDAETQLEANTDYWIMSGSSEVQIEKIEFTEAESGGDPAPSCTSPTIAWATEPADATEGAADATASVTTTPTPYSVSWTSNNTSVATVDGGTVSYVSPGFARITASLTYSGEDYCEETVSVYKDIKVLIDAITPGANDKLWYYTSAKPSSSPDDGLNFANSKEGSGMYGIKLNSSGYAWFEKPAVSGKLRVGAYASGTDPYVVNVYACDDEGTIVGDVLGTLSTPRAGGVSTTMNIAADVEGIRINRSTGSEGVLYFIEFEADPVVVCGATIPGDISKGTLSAGVLTLNAAGSPLTGDTWYWQSSASGEDDSDEYDAENGKEVSAAGTYYLRSYNTAGDCWSAAKSFTVTAEDLVESYTVVYKDGETTLGSETVEVGEHPTAAGITTTKEFYTFAAWQESGVDKALNVVSAANGETVTLTARYTGNYAYGTYLFNSLTMGSTISKTITEEEVVYNDAFRVDNFYFAAGIKIQGETGTAEQAATLDNYKGWKLKTNAKTIKFLVENNSQVKVAIGEKTGIQVTYTPLVGAETTASQAKDNETAYSVKGGTVVTITTTSDNTTTLKRLSISNLYNVTYTDGTGDASGSASNVPEVTLPTPTETIVTVETVDYSFTGWKANQAVTVNDVVKSAGTLLNAGDVAVLGANTTFTAQWAVVTPKYAITKGTHTNGDFTIDPAEQEAGETVTLTATPNEDYLFSAWDVYKTGESSTKVSVTNNAFTMPAYGVTVNATFAADPRQKVLYLTTTAEETVKANDKLYAALKDIYNVKIEAPASQTLTDYALVVLHESIGGTSSAAAVAGCKTTSVPVLNTKSYFYPSGRWNWGTPNAGTSVKGATLNSAYCNIANHPLFTDVTVSEGFFEITDDAAAKCMQPVGSFSSGYEGYTLATTPNSESGNGCAIHEIPAGTTARGVSSGKYLMISVSNAKLDALNANGQKLFQNAAAYLIGNTAWEPVNALSSPAVTASPSAAYSVGDNIALTASATGSSAATTYTWYKGDTWAAAEEAGAIQAAATAASNGNTYGITGCALGDAGTYWCVISNGTGCEVSASLAITVSDIAYNISFSSAHGTAPTATTGVSYTLPELSASGWEHQGWTASIDVTVDAATVTAGTKIANGKIATFGADVTFTAVWTQVFDVTFNLQDHGAAIDAQHILNGGKATEPNDPAAIGWVFGGWYKEAACTNEWDFANDVVAEDTELFAKWTAFAGCTELWPATSGDAPAAIGDAIVMQSGSNGAAMTVVAKPGKLAYTSSGLQFGSESGVKVKVVLNNDMTVGTKISLTLVSGGTSARGLDLYNAAGSSKITTLGWSSTTTNGAEDTFTYTVVAEDGLDGTNEFQLWRNNTVCLKSLKVESCGSAIVYHNLTSAVDPTGKGTVTLGASSVREGLTTTATYSAIDEAYEFDEWQISGTGASIADASANPAVITMGTADAVVTLKLKAATPKHTVSYNVMGHGVAPASEQVKEGAKVTKPANPSADNWAFIGWYKEEGLVNAWNFDVDVMGDDDMTLYAKWEDETGAIKLFDGEGNLNTTKFVSPAKTTIEINEVEYTCLAQFSSNRTSLGGATPSDMVQYNATTDAAKIKMTFYNNNSGVKKAILYKYEEGAESPEKIEIEVPGQTIYTTDYYEFNSSKNRSFYVCMNDRSNIRVLQVMVMDNGTAIQQAGQAGYSLNLNKGRMYVSTSAATSFEGATINVSSEYKVYNNGNMATNSYISFTTTVDKMILKVTRSGGNYYVSQDPENKGTSYNTNKEIELSPAGTWYLGSISSGSAASFTKIEFIAPKCEAPAFNALANSDICSGYAYVALDGTGTVSDGGSITYKWYAEDDAETVLATTATYTPIADGSYYVVALHHVDGYTDNEVTSDVVTVKTHAGTAISEPLADQRGNVDDVVALEVVASGKNLHYAWKECATIDGEYTAVVGAADAASLDVTITEGMDKYYKVIVSSDCGDAQESVAHVTQYVPVAQANVTGSIAWDWANAASVGEIKLTTTSTPKKNEGFVMANGAATIYNNANFESDKLYLEGEYIVRDGKYFQGQTIKFNTTVAGLVRVKFSHTGNATEDKPARELYINGVATGDSRTSATAAWSRYVEVQAGEVSITAYYVDPVAKPGQQYIRVPEIEFYALDQVRSDSWIAPGELGTVCYPNGHIVVGADMYQMAGVDENHKFAFDQVTVTEPGVPYLFEATGYDPIKFYKTTAAAVAEAGTSNGMVGTFVAMTLSPAEGENLYYFQGTHFYSVADRTKNLSVPANRCYVDLNEPHPAAAPAPGRRRITFGVNGTNTATGVENIQTTEISIQKVLIDGKMYILRGEKMYDATGRLVK